ncbi:MAG: type IV pilus biogenesis/stability protein PilW [Rhodocyclaceae bacterium]|nr:type IV pilus biogenesis/stability protein PilW [Rhodocyclaceae bacterium]
MRVNVLLLSVLFLMAGCATSPSASLSQPVAQQSGKGDKRNRARVHAELGFAYYESQRLGPALEEARVAIGIDSGYALAYNLLGLVYTELREKTSAEEAFHRALQLAPGDPDISNSYGWFLCQVGQEQKAQTYFQAAVHNPLYTAPVIALLNSATCALKVKNDALATDALGQILQLDPENLRALYLTAEISYRAGRFGEARLRLSELHRRSEPTAETSWLALRVARKLGDRSDEARFMALLRQKFPDSPETQKTLQGISE